MTNLLVGAILGLILGSILGAFLVMKFNIVDTTYSIDRLKAKKGGKIDLKQDINSLNNKQNGNTKGKLAGVGNRINGFFKGRGKFNPKRKRQ